MLFCRKTLGARDGSKRKDRTAHKHMFMLKHLHKHKQIPATHYLIWMLQTGPLAYVLATGFLRASLRAAALHDVLLHLQSGQYIVNEYMALHI